LELNARGKKNVRFQSNPGHILETVKDTVQVTINH